MAALKPQDFAVALLLALHPEQKRYSFIAATLGLSVSEAHASVKRARHAKLLGLTGVRRAALLEFAVHGARYAFPPSWTAMTRGIPTAYSVPQLAKRLRGGDDVAVVWPYAKGTARGMGLQPLYPSLPRAAINDERVYLGFALVDLLRVGGARERDVGEGLLKLLLAKAKAENAK